jgi:hypothetical protein
VAGEASTEASRAWRGPMAPSSPEWEARAVATPRWRGPSLLEARVQAVEEGAVAARRGY